METQSGTARGWSPYPRDMIPGYEIPPRDESRTPGSHEIQDPRCCHEYHIPKGSPEDPYEDDETCGDYQHRGCCDMHVQYNRKHVDATVRAEGSASSIDEHNDSATSQDMDP